MKFNMKNQQLFNILTIPEPCSEHWESMQHNASGAYCEKCAKSVVDFSQKSDKMILLNSLTLIRVIMFADDLMTDSYIGFSSILP